MPPERLRQTLAALRRARVAAPRWRQTIRRAQLLFAPRPEALAALLRALLARENPVSTTLRFHARHDPSRVAIETPSRRVTYGDLDARVDHVAHLMQSRGVGPGDGVAVMLSNRVEFFEVSLAAARLRARLTPMSDKYKAREVGYILEHSAAKLLVTEACCLDALEGGITENLRVLVVSDDGEETPHTFEDFHQALASTPPQPLTRAPRRRRSDEEGQVVMYTSGTTGQPKGAQRDLRAFTLEGLLNVIDGFDLRRDDRLFVCTPLYHAAPWALSSLVMGLGGAVILDHRWRGAETLEAIEAANASVFLVVPTLVRRWLDLPEPSRPSSLRRVISAGARFPARWKLEATERIGELFCDFYGATELGIITISRPSDARTHPESVGPILPHIEVRLITPDGADAAPGERGELYARGQNFEGYLKDSSASNRGALDDFFSVGDVAIRDADGYLYIVDRSADMVVSGGVNIYPAEVESVLREHPAVNDVAVVGVPHADFGEALHAVIVLSAGLEVDAETLIAFCGEHLARFKRPRAVTFTDVLPCSPQGKVLKRQIVAQLCDAED